MGTSVKSLQIENVSITYSDTLIVNFSLFPPFTKRWYFRVLPRSTSGVEKKDTKHFLFIHKIVNLKNNN